MEDKIKELRKEGKTVREIAEILNIGRDKTHKLIKKLESDISINKESDKTDTIDKDDPNEYNSFGVKKLRKSDYTKEELEAFPDAPYWD